MKLLRRFVNLPTRELTGRSKGQAIVLLAFMFIGLIAFVGLVVDLGVALTRYAQLRRTVDAAGVQAANQFREGRVVYNSGQGGDLYSSVLQIMATQGFYSPTVRVRIFACLDPDARTLDYNPADPDSYSGQYETLTDELCGPSGQASYRKLVRVDSEVDVGLPFLSIIGWRTVTLKVTTIGESAGLDVVLVLDRSGSMVSDSRQPGETLAQTWNRCGTNCKPYRDVRDNAQKLVNRLRFPQDRMAIVFFDRFTYVYDAAIRDFRQNPDTIYPTMFITQQSVAESVVLSYTVQVGCQEQPGMPGICTNTNIGGAIKSSTQLLTAQGRRRGSVWLMVLLTDGSPNVTNPIADFTGGACPPETWPPADCVNPPYTGPGAYSGGPYTVTGYAPDPAPPPGCTAFGTYGKPPYSEPYCLRIRDDGASTTWPDIDRTCIYTDTSTCGPGVTLGYPTAGYKQKYDADDYARDMADYMAANGIVAFVIGLGKLVSGFNEDGSSAAINLSDYDNSGPAGRDPRAGERLLRYIADMGDDPDADLTDKLWQCHSNYWDDNTQLDPMEQCGNYWYAATGAGLTTVFEEIASRMFTRLTE